MILNCKGYLIKVESSNGQQDGAASVIATGAVPKKIYNAVNYINKTRPSVKAAFMILKNEIGADFIQMEN